MTEEHADHQFGVDGPMAPRIWPAMTEAERRLLIPHYPFLEDAPEISHHSPRPFSSACIFSGASGRFFVKRHDHRVKNEASLREEHRFAQYLAGRALPVQPFLKNNEGETVTRCGDWVYELTAASPDIDLYRDVQSWEGWFNPAQAHAGGRLLAQFHDVMEDDTAPARAYPQLVSNMDMLRRDDFASALDAAVADLTPAGRGLLHHSAYKQARAAFHTFHDALNPLLSHHKPCWGHGDWHGSNLMWRGTGEDAVPVSVFDFGMADRTSTLFDLAIAIERSMITWLAPDISQWQVRYDALGAFLRGYEARRPLSATSRQALAAVLPLCHVHFALSEYRYFASLLHDDHSARVAFEKYFIGHMEWFQTPPGESLLRYIVQGEKPGGTL